MDYVRINISLPKTVVAELSKRLPPRKRSKFIAEALKKQLQDQKAQRLVTEYQEAAAEIRRINRDLEGTLSDGLD